MLFSAGVECSENLQLCRNGKVILSSVAGAKVRSSAVDSSLDEH